MQVDEWCIGKAAQDGGGVSGVNTSPWGSICPQAPWDKFSGLSQSSQEITVKQCYLRECGGWGGGAEKACWSPQVILKISLLKLLVGLTDTTSTSVVPQLPH